MFHVPSTPDAHRELDTSTTPIQPPPSGVKPNSFTPAGKPPPSVLGVKQPNVASRPSQIFPEYNFADEISSFKGPAGGTMGFKGGFAVPDSSPLPSGHDDLGPVDFEHDAFDLLQPGFANDPINNTIFDGHAPGVTRLDDSMMLTRSPRGAKRSRNGNVMASSGIGARAEQLLASRNSTMSKVAKGLAAAIPIKRHLQDPDDVILRTEHALASLDVSMQQRGDLQRVDHAQPVVKDLINVWAGHCTTESMGASIGPAQDSDLTRATYVASLALSLHHPCQLDVQKLVQQSKRNNTTISGALWSNQRSTTPIPKALLDWLNVHHNPYPDDIRDVVATRPSSTANERYWDTVFSTMLRGSLDQTIELLETADFGDAETALEDGYDEPGYQGRQLQSAQEVVARSAEVLRLCPACTDDDWDVKGPEWSLFRSRVSRALEDLESFAEDNSADRDQAAAQGNVFQNSRFGASSISAASRRAESKVPWTIYQQLKVLYGQLLGRRDEIVDSAQDWLEAVIYLTVWWDGDEGEGLQVQGLYGRRTLRKHGQQTREVDVSPTAAYKKRLLLSFADVTDEPQDVELGVNTLDPVQVALACVFEDEVAGLAALLRAWSMPVAAAVVDVASSAGWLPQGRGMAGGVMDAFDQDDLMVLSHAQEHRPGTLRRDDIMVDYASLIAENLEIRSSDGREALAGWELAIRVLSRLDHAETAERSIGQILDEMEFETADQVNAALAVCDDLGLSGQSHRIAQRFADKIAKTSQAYGQAILYYARGRCTKQLQSTVDLLICTSLVQSAAYPAADALDDQLRALLEEDRALLKQLARVDMEAAQLITKHVSGYAMLRRFYNLRDEPDDEERISEDSPVVRSGLGPRARKREAAKAMLVLIQSAADWIHGGLYDADTDAVVQVDTLLALLGEALPLLNQKRQLCQRGQLMTLLRAIEDIETVTPRIYEQAQAMFHAAMRDYHGDKASASTKGDRQQQQMTQSFLSASSYGLVNSNGSLDSAGGDRYRGWDWRKGMAMAIGEKASGADVLRVLRVQIAKDLAKVMLDETE